MDGKDNNQPILSIGVVQQLTGLTGRQIRYYESAELIRPYRTRGNQRLYSWADVERLRSIKTLIDQGYNVEGVRNHLGKASADSRSTVSMVRRTERLSGRDLIKQRSIGMKLSSLFPVNNQAELSRFLQARQKH